MQPKIIKSDSDYKEAVAAVEKLMDLAPEEGTAEREQLDLLTLLVQEYESRIFKRKTPSAIEAILFRMEQEGLTQRDLIPYVGSRSKVSEVLSGKRPLTLQMIRALHFGLGIPAKALLQERDISLLEPDEPDWEKFPLREMIARGWISNKAKDFGANAENLLRQFFAGLPQHTGLAALYRKSDHVRSARTMDWYALSAWTARIVMKAQESATKHAYEPEAVNLEFMRKLAQLSWSEKGPLLAQEFLHKHGISLVIEPHLSRTYLDGAAIMIHQDRPIIGLTLRHDRMDNFWYSLMHELSHIALHLESDTTQFYDDLDVESKNDPREEEADKLAGEALIPEDLWHQSPASRTKIPGAAELLAKQLNVHPAIVAGRMRHHFGDFRILNNLIGHHQVRKLFPEINWET